MRFMDELRGSVGEGCRVLLAATETRPAIETHGRVESLSESTGLVYVRADDGHQIVAPFAAVQLDGEEGS